jgi:N-acetylmuramoyl-L-alanine amidase
VAVAGGVHENHLGTQEGLRMTFVSRSELGWPASAAPLQATTKGVKVHYLGEPFTASSHADCVKHVKEVRLSHLANKAEGYSDIAYNFLACRHGYLFEGRGVGKRTGANGNQDLNKGHYAICALLGSKGDLVPTKEMIQSIRDGIELLRKHGAGSEIKGHRDGYATACPGGPLYALVTSGDLVPVKVAPKPTPKPVEAVPKPSPIYAVYPGRKFFEVGRTSPLITAMGKRLVAAGWKGYKFGPGPRFSRTDVKAVAWFQRKQGWEGADADGYPGAETWKRLKVPKS